MTERKQHENGSGGIGRGGRSRRISRVAFFVGVAFLACTLTVGLTGTAAAQQQITDANDLDKIRNDLNGDFVLTNDIDMNNYNGDFAPIGNCNWDSGFDACQGDGFSGTLDGNGNTIRNLNINLNERDTGLFDFVELEDADDTVIENLGIKNASVQGESPTGILIGIVDEPNVATGDQKVLISNTYVEGNVTALDDGSEGIGGLVGYGGEGVSEIRIENSHAIVNAEAVVESGPGGQPKVGTLVGDLFRGNITDSWGDGEVRAIAQSGTDGLVRAGGLVGDDSGFDVSTIKNSFSIADVVAQGDGAGTDFSAAGGVVGSMSGNLETSFAAGNVDATNVGGNAGGLVGDENVDPGAGEVTGSYWDTQATGLGVGIGNTSDDGASANMVAFNFPDEWRERPSDYPVPAGVFPASVVGTNEPIQSGEAVIDLHVAYSGPGSINNFDVGILIDGGIDSSGRHTDSIRLSRNGETTTTLTNDNIGSGNASLDVQFLDPQTWTIIQDTLQVESSPTADAGGPYTVNEGGSVTLDGTGSSDPDGSIVAHRWDLDGDGSFEATGSTTTFDASTIDGTTSVNVDLEVEDDSGKTDTDSTTVTVSNVAPSVSADNGAVTVDEGQTATNTGSYSDPVDSVSLSASTGTVTDEGSGTWSWSYSTSDGPDDGEAVTITADDGEDTSSTTFDLTVNNVAPTVTIDSLPSTADEGDTVALSASFSDPGSDTHTATVDWGDGTTETVSVDQSADTLSASHTYDDDGIYTVTVTVEDDDGDSGTDSSTVDVANVAPSVTIDSLPGTVDEGDTVALDASFSDPGSADTHTATVDWGDGTTESVSVDQTADTLSASHTYDDNGSYPVTVTVEDDDGGTDTVSEGIDVNNVAPTIDSVSLPSSADEGDTVALDASFSDPGSADTHTATVDWGDGTSDSVSVDQSTDTLSASHTYDDNGSYTVTVTVEDDDGGSDSDSSTVDVANVAPTVTIDSLPGTADEGETVSLGASFSDVDADTHSATINWGDGTTESASIDQTADTLSSSHTYDENGSYTVTVTVEDDDGGSGSDTATVDVANVAPSVTIDSLPSTADEGDTVALDASFSDPGNDMHSATINWGDGTTESVSVDQTADTLSASHTYTDDGSYPVTVTVTDDDGSSGSDTATVDVANVAPTVTIDSVQTGVDGDENATLNASFSDPGSDDTHTATVDWGDGTTESVGVDQSTDTLSATHAYADGGSYTVTVTVEDDDGGTDTAEETLNVQTDCLNRREISRGQESQECPKNRTIERGGSREELDRETDRRSDTKRRDRSRGERRNSGR
jgi:PKD repeat protein